MMYIGSYVEEIQPSNSMLNYGLPHCFGHPDLGTIWITDTPLPKPQGIPFVNTIFLRARNAYTTIPLPSGYKKTV